MKGPETRVLYKIYFCLKELAKRNVFNLVLKIYTDVDCLMYSINMFHAVLPATENERSPNLVVLDGTTS